MFLLQGTATEKLLPILNKNGLEYQGPYESLQALFNSLKNYLEEINNESKNDEIVVFSPGATSFGMFNNEFDRDDKFMKGIRELF